MMRAFVSDGKRRGMRMEKGGGDASDTEKNGSQSFLP